MNVGNWWNDVKSGPTTSTRNKCDATKKQEGHKLDESKLKKLKKFITNKIGQSSKQLSKKFEVNRTTKTRNLAKIGLKYRKDKKHKNIRFKKQLNLKN